MSACFVRGGLSALALVALASSIGCGGTGDPAAPGWAPASATPQLVPPPPKRTVEQRNPFGNTSSEANLMADGDFELTGRQDQMPWLAFDGNGQKTLDFETGGRCRSGVRCVSMSKGDEMIGWLASPHDGGIDVSLWAKPKSNVCTDLEVHVLDLETQSDGATIAASAPGVDLSGWCHFTGTAPSLANRSAVVYVAVKGGVNTTILVDDVFAKPGVLTTKTRAFAIGKPLDPSQSARLQHMSGWLKTHRRFGLPPERLIDDPPINAKRWR
jgi:hypothetical protein